MILWVYKGSDDFLETVKVRVSMNVDSLPDSIVIDVPANKCNREDFIFYLNDLVNQLIIDSTKITFEVLDNVSGK